LYILYIKFFISISDELLYAAFQPVIIYKQKNSSSTVASEAGTVTLWLHQRIHLAFHFASATISFNGASC